MKNKDNNILQKSVKRRNLVKTFGGIGVATVATTALATPALSKGIIQWKMQMTWGKNSPLLSTGPKLVADHITKASDGRLAVKLYAAGEIAPHFKCLIPLWMVR